jgi:SAM-dependent methyltransferase
MPLKEPGSAPRGSARLYNERFYEYHYEQAAVSAQIVVPLVTSLLAPTSVLDIGCGLGQWLAAFLDSGVSRVIGIDGAHVDLKKLWIPREAFCEANLEKPLRVEQHFDLACSLEVAEHLSKPSGTALVAALCAAAPVVMFSAAIPQQGGVNHINEQWPSYWIEKFAERGFRVFDAVRPRIMSDSRVDSFYRQNVLIFACEEGIAIHPALSRDAGVPSEFGLEWVHIELYKRALDDYQTLLRAPAALLAVPSLLRRAILRTVQRRLSSSALKRQFGKATMPEAQK